MPLAIGLGLILFSLAVVALPFLKSSISRRFRDPIRELQEQREAIYQEIRILQSDLALGHLSQEVYEESLREYRIQAAELVMQEETSRELDSSLEDEIQSLREEFGLGEDVIRCPNCGVRVDDGENECPECGAELIETIAETREGRNS